MERSLVKECKALPQPDEREKLVSAANRLRWSRTTWAALLVALTLFTLAVHGYHPLSEDGGLYVAGVYLKLDPALFPYYGAFVRSPMLYSEFAALLASIARVTHLPVPWVVLITWLATTGLMFFAAWQVVKRCTDNEWEQLGGLALLAAWWTLPVAGTSLVLMDPYVTARSFSTPLTLLALAYASDDWSARRPGRHWFRHPAFLCAVTVLVAGWMHLLMAAYALAFVAVLRACMAKRPAAYLSGLALAAVLLAALLQAFAPPESGAWLAAEYTRYYWFLSQWHWFELAGLAGPLLVLVLIARDADKRHARITGLLCRACIATGVLAFLVALLFARESASTHLVARLQPLRVFLTMYALMTLLLGFTAVRVFSTLAAGAGSRLKRLAFRVAPLMFLLCSGIGMYAAQRDLYPGSQHLELPWRVARTGNPWIQAFLWIRRNTPANALFAMDAHYITTPGEDAQTFRALSLHDALPDYSKDGGEASIAAPLAPVWAAAATAQLHLNKATDAERQQRLLPFGVTWLVLQAGSPTGFPCPYNNGTIKVCRLIRSSGSH